MRTALKRAASAAGIILIVAASCVRIRHAPDPEPPGEPVTTGAMGAPTYG